GPAPIAALEDALLNAVASADFNGDGNADLAAGLVDTTDVAVLLGDGNGTFQPEMRFPAGVNPFAVAAADFNGDGHPDLAVAVANWIDSFDEPAPAGGLSILLGTGTGTFTAGPVYSTLPWPNMVVAADVDLDGDQDLLLVTLCDFICVYAH